MKRNIDDFDGMKDFIISIVAIVAWVLIGSIISICYFTIETKGESVALSFISTIFTIISSLGIIATIGVYFKQKKDQESRDNENHNKKKESIKRLIKKCVVDFDYCINEVESNLFVGDINEAVNKLNKINNKNIEICLIASKDIDIEIFYHLCDLMDKITKNKNFLIRRITSGSNTNPLYYEATLASCYQAKKEIEKINDLIESC
ncbi:hypothetical protein [Proteus vulgaris]|uniref:hypothetical protein n=1 Tax=Proteus vulgaris TaxID=585 RepID=UPI0032DA2C21